MSSSLRIGLAILTGLLVAGTSIVLAAAPPREWKERPASPLARTEVGGGKAGGALWVAGGFGPGGEPSDQAEKFDPKRLEWEVMPDLPIMLNHAGVFGYRGHPYVFGGFTDVPLAGSGTASGRLFRFDGDRWTELAAAPDGRAAFALGRVGHRVYVAGGAVGSRQKSSQLDIYNLRRDRWRRGPDMAVDREHLAGAVAGSPHHRFLYAIGGRDFYGSANYTTVERFNPRTMRWRAVADTSVGHAGFGAAGVGRRVIAVGGEAPGSSPEGTIPTAEIYRPNRDSWRALPDLPTPRHGLAVTVLGGTAYAAQGGTVTSLGISNVVESLRVRR